LIGKEYQSPKWITVYETAGRRTITNWIEPAAVRAVTESDRDSLDDVSGYPALPAVVKPGRARVGVPGKVLHVFERCPVRQ